jgi:S-DNA-T family DNA segregation ATPase FtsK/SpoIIIE
MPYLDLLDESKGPVLSDKEVRDKSRIITETLSQFGLPVEVVEVRRGPTVTQFGVAPGFTERSGQRRHKVRVGQIASLADDLALALAASSLRVEAPVPGRSVVGIEVPNEEIGLVTLRSVMEDESFQSMRAPLALALGEDVAGSPVVADLGLMPHLLIAGTTGSGKSVCIKSIATGLAMINRPDELRMVMIDPKMVELVRFRGLPHLLGSTEVELERIVRVLRWVAHEMDQRYKKFAAASARNLDDYNSKVGRAEPEKKLPRIIVFIDELADLMMLAPEETERTICRIAQMARATGIHLVVATQRPSTDVVTGLIKANFPARISFATASQIDSRVILDMPGAETLLGRGDMLYLASDAGHPVRVQGCFVSEEEIEKVVESWRMQIPRWPTAAPWESMIQGGVSAEDEIEINEDEALIQEAIRLVQRRKTISASYLQRQLRIGYPRAARLIELLEAQGLVGPQESAGRPRRVIGGEGN